MIEMKKQFSVLKQGVEAVLQRRPYFNKFISASLATAVASLFLMNFVSLPALIFQRELLLADEPAIENIVFLLVFSLLAGLAFALYSLKTEEVAGVAHGVKETVAASFGGFAALFTSACGICQPLLFFAVGVPASFAFLPLKGFEFRIASIALLASSIYFMSKSVVSCADCRVSTKR